MVQPSPAAVSGMWVSASGFPLHGPHSLQLPHVFDVKMSVFASNAQILESWPHVWQSQGTEQATRQPAFSHSLLPPLLSALRC